MKESERELNGDHLGMSVVSAHVSLFFLWTFLQPFQPRTAVCRLLAYCMWSLNSAMSVWPICHSMNISDICLSPEQEFIVAGIYGSPCNYIIRDKTLSVWFVCNPQVFNACATSCVKRLMLAVFQKCGAFLVIVWLFLA